MASHLTAAEREVVSQMVAAGASDGEIGAALGRPRSTVWRERRRNGDGDGEYSAVLAQQRAERRRRERPLERKMDRPQRQADVRRKLAQYWSPDQIAGRAREEFPDDDARRVSHQTIYTWIRSRPAEERRQLESCLRRHGRSRPKNDGRGRLPNAASIAGRPQVVEQRKRVGDWEGDTVVGARHSGVVVTLVERKTGYLQALKSCDRTARRVRHKVEQMLRPLPPQLRRTATFDRGKEFAEHQRLAHNLGLQVYFADPYCSWQRGTNEHTNGLLRQYFPRGVDFDCVSWRELEVAVHQLNDRPRKRLDYQTPAEALAAACAVAIET